MTPEETLATLGYFTTAWPNWQLPEETVDRWIEHMQDVPAEVAGVAARRIVAQDQWAPTIARFREVAKAVQPPETVKSLPLPRIPVDEARERIAESRRALRPRAEQP